MHGFRWMDRAETPRPIVEFDMPELEISLIRVEGEIQIELMFLADLQCVKFRSHMNYLGTLVEVQAYHVIQSRDNSRSPPLFKRAFLLLLFPLSLGYDKTPRDLGTYPWRAYQAQEPFPNILIDIVASKTGNEIVLEPARFQTSHTLCGLIRLPNAGSVFRDEASSPVALISSLLQRSLSLNLAWKS